MKKLIPVVAVALASETALADSRVYPGSACLGGPSASVLWGIANNTSSPVNIYCPIKRIADGTPWSSITVGFYDRDVSGNNDIVCQVFTSNSDGSGSTSTPPKSISPSIHDYLQISFSNNASGWANNAQVVVVCTIPALASAGASHVANLLVTDLRRQEPINKLQRTEEKKLCIEWRRLHHSWWQA